jgi:hypothetical protein
LAISHRTGEFVNSTCNLIVKNLCSHVIPDTCDFDAVIDILSQAAVHIVDLLCEDHDAVWLSISMLFSPNRAVFSSPGLGNPHKVLCQRFLAKRGLDPLRGRIESPAPPKQHFLTFLRLVFTFDGHFVLGELTLAEATAPVWRRIPAFLRGLDDKSLRAADFDQLLKIASYCIAKSRTVSPERTDVFRAFLDFAFLCLRSDFLEKQLLATRIFALCIQLMERMEHYQAILTEWLESNDVLELVAAKDLHEQVLSGLITPLKRLMCLKAPSEQHLTNLWGMPQRYGSGHVIRPCRYDYDPEELPTYLSVTDDGEEPLYSRHSLQLQNGRNQYIIGSIYYHRRYNVMDCGKCVMCLHGNSSCKLEGQFLVPNFCPHGVLVCCIDLAGCGKSDGEYISLGHWEKSDVERVMARLAVTFNIESFFLWGRSMGAATALMVRSPLLKGIVVDSGYTTITDLCTCIAGSQTSVPSWLTPGAVWVLGRMVKSAAGFDIYAVRPIDWVKNATVPALFGHSPNDEFVPFE